MTLFARFAAGPLVFFLLYFTPMGAISPQAHATLAIFGWMITWWMTEPVPWAIASLLPLVLFPVLNLMPIAAAVRLYGQEIFFWIWGTVLMGYAMDRHGLAKRFSLWLLSLPVIGGNTLRLAFMFMLATALISTHVSDAATVAMMAPVGISLVSFVRKTAGIPPTARSNFGAFIALGTLYAAVAGGTATMAGLPHNALSVALLRQLGGRELSWFGWMQAGVPIFMLTLPTFYLILRFFFPPELRMIPGGKEYLQGERENLGPFTAAEKATLSVFVVMVLLFTLPSGLTLVLGAAHPLARWSSIAFALNVVPPLVLVLLFSVPINWRSRQFILEGNDALAHTPWNILFLCTAAPAVVQALVGFGFVEVAGAWVKGWGLGSSLLPIASAVIVAFTTNFVSGTAITSLAGSILIPAAAQVQWNPASMAMLIPNVALGIAFPWAGAAAGTAFATAGLNIKDMSRVGIVATLALAFIVAGVHMLLAPVL